MSNGIPEWEQQGQHSSYVTPKVPWWVSVLVGVGLGAGILAIVMIVFFHA